MATQIPIELTDGRDNGEERYTIGEHQLSIYNVRAISQNYMYISCEIKLK